MTETAIEVHDLRKTYAKGVEAVRGISFAVERGEVFALLGPNGAGKSTTVRILTTLSGATSGRARVAGFDVASHPEAVRTRIGYIAQASGVDIYATGRENVVLQGRFHGLSGGEAKARTAELLVAFKLQDAADRLVRTYSGGMKRRLDVAMGLVNRPEVLFLDEPTTGLDPESRAALWDEVGRLARGGLTILLTTHYLEEADRLARRVAIIDQGLIVAEGTPESLKGSLRGDLVKVELAESAQAETARALLSELPGVVSAMLDGPILYARVEHGSRAIPAIVGALERGGLTVAEISASRPSLDDVYLQATGHRYPGDESAAAGGASRGSR
jgi:ABC-2 type transport system ATP-binding protein